MSKWIHVFNAGDHPQGGWTTADLDRVVSSYNPGYHESPLTLGHPKDNSPAFGWVTELKREGEKLFARFKDVPEEVKQWVADGRYKKVSVSLYRNLDGRGPYLRHAGLLGGVPPQVKGMAPVAFEDDESAYEEYEIDFTENINNGGNDVKTLEERFAELEEQFKEIQTELETAKAKDDTDAVKFAEEKVARLDAEKKALDNEKKAAEFKEKYENAEKEKAAALRRSEIQSFVDKGVNENKILPAWVEMGVVDFLETLPDGKDDVVEFGEKKEKLPPRKWMENFLESLRKVFKDFDEFATKEKAKVKTDSEETTSEFDESVERGLEMAENAGHKVEKD